MLIHTSMLSVFVMVSIPSPGPWPKGLAITVPRLYCCCPSHESYKVYNIEEASHIYPGKAVHIVLEDLESKFEFGMPHKGIVNKPRI